MKEAWEIWSELLLKPTESLTASEQTIRRANIFECEFLGGGWLLNLGPRGSNWQEYTELRRTAEALAEIGATIVAKRLMEVVTIAEKMRLAENWGPDALASDAYQKIDVLEKRISPEMNSLHDKLVEFTRQHGHSVFQSASSSNDEGVGSRFRGVAKTSGKIGSAKPTPDPLAQPAFRSLNI